MFTSPPFFPSPKLLTRTGTFEAYDTVGSLYEFVLSCLASDSTLFELRDHATRTTLENPQALLRDVGLIPSAIVNFVSANAIAGAGGSLLSEELLQMVLPLEQ